MKTSTRDEENKHPGPGAVMQALVEALCPQPYTWGQGTTSDEFLQLTNASIYKEMSPQRQSRRL